MIKFGELELDKGMPKLPILANVEGEEKIFWLMPFRGYRFQVCCTKDGEYDCGASPVLGLGNLVLATRSYNINKSAEPYLGKGMDSLFSSTHSYSSYACTEIFYTSVVTALALFADRHNVKLHLGYQERKIIRKFCNAVYNWICEKLELESTLNPDHLL